MANFLIDLQACQTESRLRGLGRYADAMAKAMAANAGEDSIQILVNSSFRETIPAIVGAFGALINRDNIHIVELLDRCEDRAPHLRWRHRASALLREAYIEMVNPDVVFCPSFFEGYIDSSVLSINRFSRVPVVTAAHDFIPLAYKEYFDGQPDFRRHYMEKLDELKRSSRIITISESSNQEAVSRLGIKPDLITNAYEAADEQFKPLTITAEEGAEICQRLGVKRPFIFYTGGSDPRKNLGRLISAFAQLPADLRDRHQLVLAGSMPEFDRGLLEQEGRRQGLSSEKLKLTGYVSDHDLVRLYNLAELFVFPSLHEGFGLPCLEALQCGTAVLGSNTSSLPEVIGNPRALFDPMSVTDMAAKIEEALTDQEFRSQLIERGRKQASRFSWEKSAKVALNVIRSAVVKSPNEGPTKWTDHLNRINDCERRFVDALTTLSREQTGKTEQDLMEVAQAMTRNRVAAEARVRKGHLIQPAEWRLEGPFDSTYSLAAVNRLLASALSTHGPNVSLLSAEGPGEFEPDRNFLAAYPELAALHERSATPAAQSAQVVSRNMYPPRVTDMHALINGVHNYAWEETGFPNEYVAAFNESLQFATVTSRHVKRLLQSNGVSVPIAIVGNGVDHWPQVISDPEYRIEKAGYTFLHVSSCFPRKGVDVLLKSYGKAFSRSDDVLLVLKTFRNPHNRIEEMLAEHQGSNPEYPNVRLVMDDLDDAQLKALYEQCDCLVAPSRAEGFGLPIAEALLTGLHVICTGWSGQMDFLDSNTADLIDYHFARAETHELSVDSVWAEPSVEHLATLMAAAAMRLAGQPHRPASLSQWSSLSWREVASRTVEAVERAAEITHLSDPLVGWMSTYNKRCGIATYSQHLLDVLGLPTVILAPYPEDNLVSDEENVVRCWQEGKPDDLDQVMEAIEAWGLDVVVVQFNYAFYDFDRLGAFLDKLSKSGKVVVVTLHATIDPLHEPHRRLEKLVDPLSRCDRVLVHSIHDMNRLKAHGLVNNVALFPHGVIAPKKSAPSIPIFKNKHVMIASYGFFLPNKGLLELIEAIHILRSKGMDYRLSMINAEFPAESSHRLIQEARALIAKYRLWAHVQLRTDFLSDEESIELLSSADLIAYTYQETAESASGAVRYGLAAGKPVAVTPLPIFADLEDCVFKLPGTSPAQIAEGLERVVREAREETVEFAHRIERARAWSDSHAYPVLGARLSGMIRGLFKDKVSPLLAGEWEAK